MTDIKSSRSRRALPNFGMRNLNGLSPEERQQLDAYNDFKGQRHCITLMMELLMAQEEETQVPAKLRYDGLINPMNALTKSEWPGRSETGSVILPLDVGLADMPGILPIPEIILNRKAEAHLTLLSTREAEQLASLLPIADWQAAFDSEHWEVSLIDSLDLLREERPSETTRFSVIRRVHCPSLNAFRQRLAQAAGMDLAETLPHVTLYTAGHERGIGLSSLAEHGHRRLRPLAADEIREILGLT